MFRSKSALDIWIFFQGRTICYRNESENTQDELQQLQHCGTSKMLRSASSAPWDPFFRLQHFRFWVFYGCGGICALNETGDALKGGCPSLHLFSAVLFGSTGTPYTLHRGSSLLCRDVWQFVK